MEAIQQKIQVGVTNYISLLQAIGRDFAVVFTDLYERTLRFTTHLPKTTDLPAFAQSYIALLSEIYDDIWHAMDTDTVPSFFIPTIIMLLVGSCGLFLVTLIHFTG